MTRRKYTGTRRTPMVRADKLEKLNKRAVKPEDLDPCVGPRAGELCWTNDKLVRVKGYDDKWRCLDCNQIHGDLVLDESGDSAPNESENKVKEALPAPGGARLVDAQGRPLGGHDQERVLDRVAAREKRRSAILTKYGRTP